ncbi:MAG TPA: hypothetical protein DCO79_09155 [Spirochaeta sp.]|nr:hypothetical protein [Spirochaeta sp.]
MKKYILLVLIIIFSTAMLSAEDVIWGSMYSQGNFRFGIDAAVESDGSGNHLALYPEAEMILWKPLIGNIALLDVGAAIEGRAGVPISLGADFTAGAGLTGTMHLGFRGFEFTGSEYLSRIDLYVEAGIKYDFTADNFASGFGGAVKSGVNYFISDKLAVGAFYSSWGGSSGGGLAVSLKLGKTPVVKGINFEMPTLTGEFAVEPYLLQFYTLYYSANYAGGFYPGTYSEGQGTVHRVSIMDGSGTDSYNVERSKLKSLEDGQSLWGLRYRDEDDSFYYEYITDAEHEIIVVYYDSEDDGVIEMKADGHDASQMEYTTWDEYNVDTREGVTINVEAGKFTTTEYNWADESGMTVLWWATDDVPGSLVSYKMEDDSDIVTSELIDITSGNRPVLYK